MLYYEISIYPNTNAIEVIIENSKYRRQEDVALEKAICCLNDTADIDSMTEKTGYIIFTGISDSKISAVASSNHEKNGCENMLAMLSEILSKFKITDYDVEKTEITIKRFEKIFCSAQNEYHIIRARRLSSLLRIDYFNNNTYQVKQTLIPDETLTYAEAKAAASELMCGCEFREELDRIYSDAHPKEFYGHPVHYKISAAELDAAYDFVTLLTRSLYSNGRLKGRRLDKISAITYNCYDEEDMRNLFYNAQGGTVVIELFGEDNQDNSYASCYEQVVMFFDELVKKYSNNTLLIFIELSSKPGLAEKFTNTLAEDIDILSIPEGLGSRDTAIKYLSKLIDQSELAAYKDENEIREALPYETYTASKIYRIFEKWRSDSLRCKVYTAYNKCAVEKIEKADKGTAYEKLQRMVGLSDVKAIVNQIIALYKIQKLKRGHFSDRQRISKHMIFTGNPGSAKTTVARLLAQIFKENGVIESGELVECGRADLVGKFVGWTAKEVCAKFRQARGGILFIDEAYSLVDNAGSYGDEAINTIVQEMENLRDEVIVIFAGYPDKMKEFLNKNEGLRSRIAFHIDFPDYSASELGEIMDVMLDDMGYTASNGARNKAMEIFEAAVQIPDFGNGRLVRNMLEQAVMKQSERLFGEGNINSEEKDRLFALTESDFEFTSLIPCCDKRGQIGFHA